MLAEIRAAGGEVFAITSEPQALASEAEEDWALPFPAIGDPHHEIRRVCRERGYVDVYANEDYGHLRDRHWASHPLGYYQPATIALGQGGRVLYRWRCVPRRENMSGAGPRPAAQYVWDKIRASFDREDDATPDRDPEMAGFLLSWPKFLLILLAHGWFIRPRAFPLGREDDPPSANTAHMMRRVYVFLGLWLVAAFTLPGQWVALAALAWVCAMVRGVLEIYRQFQHEPDPDAL